MQLHLKPSTCIPMKEREAGTGVHGAGLICRLEKSKQRPGRKLPNSLHGNIISHCRFAFIQANSLCTTKHLHNSIQQFCTKIGNNMFYSSLSLLSELVSVQFKSYFFFPSHISLFLLLSGTRKACQYSAC